MIESKINSNPIILSTEDVETILNNEELKAQLIERLKEGIKVDLSEEVLSSETMLEKNDFFTILLWKYKNDGMFDMLGEFYADYDEIRNTYQAKPEMFKCINDFYEDNKKILIEKIFNSNFDLSKITTNDFIDYIIKNNLTQYIPAISVNKPSIELENFIINNIDSIDERINTISERIAIEFLKKGKVNLIINYWDKYTEIEKEILKLLNEEHEFINNLDLPKEFINKHRMNIKIFRYSLENDKGFDYTEEEKKIIINSPEYISVVLETIKNKTINIYSNNFIFENTEAFLEYLKTNLTLPVNNHKYLVDCFNCYPDEITKILRNILKNTTTFNRYSLSGILNTIEKIDDKTSKDELLSALFSEISVSDYKSLKDIIANYEEYISFRIMCNETINLSSYTENIILKIIAAMQETQLLSIPIDFFKDERITDAVINRFLEIKPRSIYFDYLTNLKMNDRIMEIILNPDNKLNLKNVVIFNIIKQYYNEYCNINNIEILEKMMQFMSNNLDEFYYEYETKDIIFNIAMHSNNLNSKIIEQALINLASHIQLKEYYLLDPQKRQIIDRYKNYLNFKLDNLPDDFNFNDINNYETIKLIIPVLNERQIRRVMSSSMFSDITNSIELQKMFLEKAIEVGYEDDKSDILSRINNNILIETLINNPKTIFSDREIINIVTKSMSNQDIKSVLEFIRKSKHVTDKMLDILLSKAIDNIEQNADSISIIKEIFKNENFIINTRNASSIIKLLTYTKENPNLEESKELYKLILDYCDKHTNIPIVISSLLDEQIRKKCTYNFENLTKYPKVFDNLPNESIEEFIEFIKEAQNRNIPINIYIVKILVLEDKLDVINNYQNIVFNTDNYIPISEIIDSKNPYAKILAEKYVKEGNINYILTDISDLLRIVPKEIIKERIIKDVDQIYDKVLLNKINYLITISAIKEKVFKRLKELLISDSCKEIEFNTIINAILACRNTDLENECIDLINSIKDKINFFTNILDNRIYSVNIPVIQEILAERIKLSNDALKNIKEEEFEQIKQSDIIFKTLLERLKDDTFIDQNIATIFRIPELLKLSLETNPNTINCLKSNNYNRLHIEKETYNVLKPYLISEYKVKEETLDYIVNNFDYNILKNIDEPDIKELLQSDLETAKRIYELLKVRIMDYKTVASINDSLKQEEYLSKHEYERKIFNNTLNRINHKELFGEALEYEIRRFCEKDKDGNYKYMPKELIFDRKKIEEKMLNPDITKNLNDKQIKEIKIIIEEANSVVNIYKNNKEDSLRLILMNIPVSQTIYADLFHQITDSFLEGKRREVQKSENIFVDTDVVGVVNERAIPERAFAYLCQYLPEKLIEELNKKNISEDLLTIYKKIIKHFPNELSQLTNDEKKNIKSLKKELGSFLSSLTADDLQSFGCEVPYFEGQIAPIIRSKPNTGTLKQLRIHNILQIVKDEKLYNLLLELVEKYKILEWDNIFTRLINDMSLCEGSLDMYNFINCFKKIYEDTKNNLLKTMSEDIELMDEIRKLEESKNGENDSIIDKKINILKEQWLEIRIKNNFKGYSIIKNTILYSSYPNAYKILFGIEDFELIRNNPQSNAAHKPANETVYSFNMRRLEKDRLIMMKALKNNEVTIPSFVKEYDTSRRPLQVTVGCRSDVRNLTHGERTGACMRAFGVASDLFEFCATDSRGFHITFTDPVDNEYISRVSGFRNGNTVYLNELRFSCNEEKYSNNDVVKATKELAEDLIAISKNSPMPIENVVCSPKLCLENYPTQELTATNNEFSYFGGWLDVEKFAVVLATSGENGMAVPVKLDKENQPKYKCCRLKPQIYTNNKITDKIKILMQRINALKEINANQSNPDFFQSIDYDYDILNNNFIYAIIGQDYYVAIDGKGNIINNIYSNEEEALAEYKQAMGLVQEQVASISNGGMKIG